MIARTWFANTSAPVAGIADRLFLGSDNSVPHGIVHDMVATSSAHESRLMHGVLEMCVLALLDDGPLHAYGIVQRLGEHGFENASYGSIYPLATRLRKQGLVDQRLESSSSGPARNVLAINAQGRAALAKWTDQWHQTSQAVSAVLASLGNARTVEPPVR